MPHHAVAKVALPHDLGAYNKKPWKALRDVAAAATWRAEELRAKGNGSFDVDAAMAQMDVSPFNWLLYDDRVIFVVWTSGPGCKKQSLRYHLTSVSIHRLLHLIAGADK